MISVRGNRKIVLEVGSVYSDELWLSWEILGSAQLRAQHFAADGYYDSGKLIRYLEENSVRCVIPISETLRKGVRNEYRTKVKKKYEDERYYRIVYRQNRYRVGSCLEMRRRCGETGTTIGYMSLRGFL